MWDNMAELYRLFSFLSFSGCRNTLAGAVKRGMHMFFILTELSVCFFLVFFGTPHLRFGVGLLASIQYGCVQQPGQRNKNNTKAYTFLIIFLSHSHVISACYLLSPPFSAVSFPFCFPFFSFFFSKSRTLRLQLGMGIGAQSSLPHSTTREMLRSTGALYGLVAARGLSQTAS